jgi:hypothetical protein
VLCLQVASKGKPGGATNAVLPALAINGGEVMESVPARIATLAKYMRQPRSDICASTIGVIQAYLDDEFVNDHQFRNIVRDSFAAMEMAVDQLRAELAELETAGTIVPLGGGNLGPGKPPTLD